MLYKNKTIAYCGKVCQNMYLSYTTDSEATNLFNLGVVFLFRIKIQELDPTSTLKKQSKGEKICVFLKSAGSVLPPNNQPPKENINISRTSYRGHMELTATVFYK